MSRFVVFPMAQTIELEPRTIYKGYISVSNPFDAEEDFHYKITVGPYSVKDKNYTADLTTVSDRSQIVKWIEIDEPTGTVKPNEVKKVYFTITIPERAPAGGQYATINVSANKDETQSSSGVMDTFAMSSIIYADVAGEDIHEGQFLGASIPGFTTTPVVTATAEFTNTGNVHEVATTTTTITNIFTGEIIYPVADQENVYTEIIMPESERLQMRELLGFADLGVYNVTEEIAYLGEKHPVSQTVIVCPLWFIFLIVFTIIVIIWTISRIIVNHHKAKSRIKFQKEDHEISENS